MAISPQKSFMCPICKHSTVGTTTTRDYLKAWVEFTRGHWQIKMPEEPGVYPTMSREGKPAKYRQILRHPTKKKLLYDPDKMVSPYYRRQDEGSDWVGWWWSRPIPALPVPPEWPKEGGGE
jgi:hypothetical protein